MKVRNSMLAAAVAAMTFGTAALAADQSSSVPQQADLSSSPLYLDASTPTTLTPVMYELDKTSFGKTIESWNLSVTGFVEGGYFYDTNNPRSGTPHDGTGDKPTDILFPGNFSNRGVLDQLDLTIAKTVDTTKSWDWGFFVEGGYGIDDSQIHSSGILDNRVGQSPDNQLDLVQANVTLLLPIGSGLQIEAGKFVTLLSNEVINPTGNAFYTHTYNFSFGVPATQTGILGKYTFAKLVNGNDLNLIAGATRGWNQSVRDGNGAIDFLGEASAKVSDKLTLTFNLSEGPEENDPAHVNVGPFSATNKNLDGEYWTVPELIASYAASDQLTLTADLLYGDAPGDSFTEAGHAAQWYGAVLYGSYKINSYFTANVRGEYYRDQGGATVGDSLTADGSVVSANFYALTVGTQIHPFPTNDILQWLQFRPEVRYDLSDKPAFNAAHSDSITGTGDYSEFTVAMDAIMQF
jgi:hypothetical protein